MAQQRSSREWTNEFVGRVQTDADVGQLAMPNDNEAPVTAADREALFLGMIHDLYKGLADTEGSGITAIAAQAQMDRISRLVRLGQARQQRGVADLAWKSSITMPEFGDNDTLVVKAKENGIYICDGTSNCFRTWMNRINHATKGATPERWLAIASSHSSGDLLRALEIYQRRLNRGEPLEPREIINRCEVSFGPARSPKDAIVQLQSLRLKSGEDITGLEGRIEALVEIAVREHEAEEKEPARERMSIDALLTALPSGLGDELRRKIRQRAENAQTRFRFGQLTQEAHDLVASGGYSLNTRHASQVLDDSNSEDEGVNAVHLGAGYTGTRTAKTEYPFRTNRRSSPSRYRRYPKRRPNYRSQRINVLTDDAGEPELLEGPNIEVDINILESDEDDFVYKVDTAHGRRTFSGSSLGVSRNECLKCASTEHRVSGPGSENCPYYNDKITSKCPSCHRGGHSASRCVAVKN